MKKKLKNYRSDILEFIRKNFFSLYKVIIILGGYIKFYNKINRKKKISNFHLILII